jgi:hypothetical protein
VTTVGRVIQKIALLAIVLAGRGSGLAHLLLAVEVDLLVHVAQVLRDGPGSRQSKAALDDSNCRKVAGWCRNVCATPNGYSGYCCERVVVGEGSRDRVERRGLNGWGKLQ